MPGISEHGKYTAGGLFGLLLSSAGARASLEEVRSKVGIGLEDGETIRYALRASDALPFSEKIRVCYYLSRLCISDSDRKRCLEKCFAEISSAISSENMCGTGCCSGSNTGSVSLKYPLRVNWGGGWSDTPPYCIENGGTVFNAAVSICGRLPAEVTVTALEENKLVLKSGYGSHSEVLSLGKDDHAEWHSENMLLHKAALRASGIVAGYGGFSVGELLEGVGGGMMLSTCVRDVPRGSGLGVSSILSGACIRALHKFVGSEIGDNEIYNRVLCAEQLMDNGGGWQDQVGGMTPGIKLITSSTGIMQNIECSELKLLPEVKKELEKRFILIYTGQRRRAGDLIRDFICKYLAGEPEVLSALVAIRALAVSMRESLEQGDVDEFASMLDKQWNYSRLLDDGCRSECIERILGACGDLFSGRMVCGAGGGGFLQAVLKKDVSRRELERRLADSFPESDIGVYDCKFVMGDIE